MVWLITGLAGLIGLVFARVLAELSPTVWQPVRWLVFRGLFRVRIHPAATREADEPTLWITNQTSWFDWLVLWFVLPRGTKFILAPEALGPLWLRFVLAIPDSQIQRWLFTPGERERNSPDTAPMQRWLQAGHSVVFFVEGGLTRNGQLQSFPGWLSEWLAARPPGTRVAPLVLDRMWEAPGTWRGGRLKFWGERPWFRRIVGLYFGEPYRDLATASVAQLRAGFVEASARCGIAMSADLSPTPVAFVQQASQWKHLFRTAIVDHATGQPRELRWYQVLVGVWFLRDWLRGQVSPAPHVGIWLPTSLGSLLTNVALNLLGKTTINLNYTAGPAIVQACVLQAGVQEILTSKRFCDRVPLEPIPGVRVLYLEDALSAATKWGKLLRLLAVCLLPGRLLVRWLTRTGTLNLDQPQTILFSSGTTAEPKGVVLSYRNIAANVDSFRRGVEFHDTDRMLVTLPFFHSFGYTVSLWAICVVGMEGIIHPDPRQAKELADSCRKHRCTILLATATFLRLYMKRAGAEDFRSLRLIICGAEKLPVQLAEEFALQFGVRPYEGYGCTELSPVVSTNLPDTELGSRRQIANRPGSVGQPIPNVAMQTFGIEDHRPLPAGEEGLLGCLGANVMLGYLAKSVVPGASPPGWYITGDVGLIDADGFIHITGRISRFAKIAGEMIPLERLDEALHESLYAASGSCGERKLAVAAAPCERRGERIVLLYLPEIESELPKLIQSLRQSGLPNLWIPDLRDSRAIEQFPTLSTGKLDLKKLSELAQERCLMPSRA